MDHSLENLVWIDDFISRISPYVRVRLRDKLLIRMPNEAFKLNESGAKILAFLLAGGKIHQILSQLNNPVSAHMEIETFFQDLTRMLGGTMCDNYSSCAIDKVNFQLGYIELPVLSEVAITWQCNIACRFCYAACRKISHNRIDRNESEMTARQIRSVLRIISQDAGIPSVSFTGGEPLLRRELPSLIAYASSELQMRVNLITNGTLITPRKAKQLKKVGLASAQVSIEGPCEAIHDRITQTPGSFKASIQGLQALQNAGITVHPHMTICKSNLDVATQMPGFVKQLGFSRFSANLVIPAGRGQAGGLAVKYHEIGTVVENLIAVSAAEDIRFMWYSPTPLCLFNPIPHGLGNKGCSACEGLLSVDPMGNVLPCSSWREPVGNLLTDGFETVWFNTRAKHLRQKQAAHPGCRECPDFAICHGACPLYFQRHGYDEIEPYIQNLSQLACHSSTPVLTGDDIRR